MNYRTIIFALLLACSNLYCMQQIASPTTHEQENIPKIPEHQLPHYLKKGSLFIKKKEYAEAQKWLSPAKLSDDPRPKYKALILLTTIPEQKLNDDILESSLEFPGNTFKERVINFFISNNNLYRNYNLARLYYKHGELKRAHEHLCLLWIDIIANMMEPDWASKVSLLERKISKKVSALNHYDEEFNWILS